MLLLVALLLAPAAAMHPHIPHDVLAALAGTAGATEGEGGPPTGLGRCCFAGTDGAACLSDPNHCQQGCLDGSASGEQCKNCQCLSAAGTCCERIRVQSARRLAAQPADRCLPAVLPALRRGRNLLRQREVHSSEHL